MMNVLKDRRLVSSNHLIERGIKRFLIGGKNYLFSTFFQKACSNAAFLRFVETAKANGLHPSKHLRYLLIHLLTRKNTPSDLYLP